MKTKTLFCFAAVVTLGLGTLASGQDQVSHKSGWVPNNGDLVCDQQFLGDMWTFNCPNDGSYEITVDTRQDTETFQSCLDPVVEVFDGEGNFLALSDDEILCSVQPVCRIEDACPFVFGDCGANGPRR